jgi:asparagine synthase (glutamine-hydrolysing)
MIAMAGGEGADTMLAMTAIHGMQVRDPTSYRPFLEFCFGIPDNQYLRAGVRRWLAKRLLQGKIPNIVLNEKRRGQQAADWHLRLSRQRNALIEEIDWLNEDPAMRRRLNLTSLRDALINFPEKTPSDSAARARLQAAVTRGLTTARFIRYLEGRNN